MKSAQDIQQLFQPMLPGLLGIQIHRGVTGTRCRHHEGAAGTMHERRHPSRRFDHGVCRYARRCGHVGESRSRVGHHHGRIEHEIPASAPVGTTVTAECTPFHRGRTTMVWQTQIRNEAGKLCAVVTQTQLVLKR